MDLKMNSPMTIRLYLLIILAVCLYILGVLTSLAVLLCVKLRGNAIRAYVTAPKATPTRTKDDEDRRREEDTALWQKSILLGEKCEPPRFSGAVYYDNAGNQVPELPGSKRFSSVISFSSELNK